MENGWHLRSLPRKRKIPLASPNLTIAVLPYSLQVGVNLQLGGRSGDRCLL